MEKELERNAIIRQVLENLHGAIENYLTEHAMRWGLQPADAENVVQECWLAALVRLQAGSDAKPKRLWIWMRGMLRHKIRDVLRHKRVGPGGNLEQLQGSRREPALPAEDPGDGEEQERLCARLHDALERHAYDPNFRILLMHYLEGKGLGEVAAELDIAADLARDRQRRAMNKLRRELTGDPTHTRKRSGNRRGKRSDTSRSSPPLFDVTASGQKA